MGESNGLQAALQQVYDTMIVHCSELIGVGRAIGGFAALWYIGFHIWKHQVNNEPIDWAPLGRPFLLGYAILIFPSVIGLINGVMEPTVSGTSALVKDAGQAVTLLLEQKKEALEHSAEWQMYVGPNGSGDLDKWESLSGQSDSGVFAGLSNRVKFEMSKMSYNLRNSAKVWLSEILETLFEAAALCLNTIRTFFLIILAIFGPLVFGLAIFPRFEVMVSNWLAQYIKVFLWLPIANVFGALIAQVQQEMIKLDIAQVNASGTTSFGPVDSAYIIFLLMAIAGYCTVPMVANSMVLAGGQAINQAMGRLRLR